MNRTECRFSRDIIILPSMCDGNSRLSIPAAFDIFQNTATLHADRLDIGPAGMNRRNYFWIISKTVMHLDRLPDMMEHVEARTWIQPADRAKCERDFAVFSGDEPILMCRSIWAVMSHETGRLVPMAGLYPEGVEFEEPVPDGIVFTKIGKDFQGAGIIGEYTIRSTDIDLGGHMNNVNYIRAMFGCFSTEEIAAMGIHDIEVQYIMQRYEGETLTFMCRTAPDGSREIGAMKKDGKAAFLARLF